MSTLALRDDIATPKIVKDTKPSGRFMPVEVVKKATDLYECNHGKPKNTEANLVLAFRNEPRLAGLGFNRRTQTVEFRTPPPIGGIARPVTDADSGNMCVWLTENLGFSGVTSKGVHNAMDTVAYGNSFDPFAERIEAFKWEGKRRLNGWLPTYCGTPDDEYHRIVGARWVISTVARALSPGCKADSALVLVGPQETRKSTAARIWALSDEYFFDSRLDMKSDEGAKVLATSGAVIVEIQEVDKLTNEESGHVKSFMSLQTDKYRATYGRRMRTAPRGNVFIGTTNHEEFLMDETGGRRFWAVKVRGTIDTEALQKDIEQLWAEAVVRYKAGESWYLDTPELRALAAGHAESAFKEDAWTPLITTVMTGCTFNPTTAEVLEYALDMKLVAIQPQHTKRCEAILTRLGYVKVRKVREGEDVRLRCWERRAV